MIVCFPRLSKKKKKCILDPRLKGEKLFLVKCEWNHEGQPEIDTTGFVQ